MALSTVENGLKLDSESSVGYALYGLLSGSQPIYADALFPVRVGIVPYESTQLADAMADSLCADRLS